MTSSTPQTGDGDALMSTWEAVRGEEPSPSRRSRGDFSPSKTLKGQLWKKNHFKTRHIGGHKKEDIKLTADFSLNDSLPLLIRLFAGRKRLQKSDIGGHTKLNSSSI